MLGRDMRSLTHAIIEKLSQRRIYFIPSPFAFIEAGSRRCNFHHATRQLWRYRISTARTKNILPMKYGKSLDNFFLFVAYISSVWQEKKEVELNE